MMDSAYIKEAGLQLRPGNLSLTRRMKVFRRLENFQLWCHVCHSSNQRELNHFIVLGHLAASSTVAAIF